MDDLTRRSTESWLADLGTQVAPQTVRTRFKGLQRFTLVAEEEVDRDLMAGLCPTTPPEALVPVPSDDEGERSLEE